MKFASPLCAPPLGVLCLFLAVLVGAANASAQAAQDTRLLSNAERSHYRDLLSRSSDSAERAKVKSEMNRLIQTRQIERRKTPPAPPKAVDPQREKSAEER